MYILCIAQIYDAISARHLIIIYIDINKLSLLNISAVGAKSPTVNAANSEQGVRGAQTKYKFFTGVNHG